MPATQVWSAEQVMPQAPQLRRSVAAFTQRPLHRRVRLGQVMAPEQAPAMQFWPGAQTLPQRPQFRWSELELVQRPSQGMRGMAQPRAQLPPVHTSLLPQVRPQAPQ